MTSAQPFPKEEKVDKFIDDRLKDKDLNEK